MPPAAYLHSCASGGDGSGGFLQTHYWYRDMVGNVFYGFLGKWMLTVKAADTLQPVYGFTAFLLLIYLLALGQFTIIVPIAVIMGSKVMIDLAFYLWSVHLYRRWTGDRVQVSIRKALLSAIAEPFTFQILRHLGAIWGWGSFLTGRRGAWGKQDRRA